VEKGGWAGGGKEKGGGWAGEKGGGGGGGGKNARELIFLAAGLGRTQAGAFALVPCDHGDGANAPALPTPSRSMKELTEYVVCSPAISAHMGKPKKKSLSKRGRRHRPSVSAA